METRECCCIFYKKSEGMPRMMQTNSCKGTVYVVKKGETILDIAKMHKTTVEKLAKSNKKIRELTLPVGTVLLIDKAK